MPDSIDLKSHYDVVIIGSGAGGGTVADVLTRQAAGADVLVLEGGPLWTHEQFNERERDMSRLYFSRGSKLSKQLNVGVAAAKAVGGSTTVYTGVSFRPPADVLERWRSEFGLDFLTREFAASTLDAIEDDLNVHELPESWDNDNNRLFKEGCDELGIPAKRLRLNLEGCEELGFCNLGCRVGAKQGTMEVQLPRALDRGATLVHNAWVDRIERHEVEFTVSEPPPRTEPNVVPEGKHAVSAGAVVVAAGALNTPALLQRSQSALGWENANVGRYLTLHPAYNVNGVYPEDITNYRGFPKTWYVDAYSESEGYYLETSFYFPGVTAKNHPHFGAVHERFMRRYKQMMSILILAHDEPLARNRVTVDSDGDPVIDYRVTDAVRDSLAKGLRRSARIFMAAGCREMMMPGSTKRVLTPGDEGDLDRLITPESLNFQAQPLSSAHPQGGARMGTDPTTSVVRPDGRLHGLDSVYVADASLFPTSSKVNPYETVMLLATHVAGKVAEHQGETPAEEAKLYADATG
jgi:choline dehydrogenase-like flavoprotein